MDILNRAAAAPFTTKDGSEIRELLRGAARMKIDGEERLVGPLDAIAIPPGARHKIWNTGPEPLVLLCCCAPAYEHDDTVMVE